MNKIYKDQFDLSLVREDIANVILQDCFQVRNLHARKEARATADRILKVIEMRINTVKDGK